MTDDTEFEIVLFGATGFTGRLVAEHLAAHHGDVQWALAGRNEQKLADVRDELGVHVPLIVADAADEPALRAMAERTRVVCTTVGPYAMYGTPLVAACAATGTHYCDLTGEVHWMRRMIEAHHDTAVQTGARIVHTCGFDCIPSDVGAWWTQQQMREQHGTWCSRLAIRVDGGRGTASGGTIASLLNLMDAAGRDPEVRRVLLDPYALNPVGERSGPDRLGQPWPARDPDGRWTAPWIMELVDTRVVRRTNALLGFPWGRDFQVDERLGLGRGPLGLAASTAVSAAMAGGVATMAVGPARRLVAKALPVSGEGPSARTREKGWFALRFEGTATNQSISTRVTGDRDPGYGATARMMGEAAVCLARDELDSPPGMLTPSVAMGNALVGRLTSSAGMTFEVLG